MRSAWVCQSAIGIYRSNCKKNNNFANIDREWEGNQKMMEKKLEKLKKKKNCVIASAAQFGWINQIKLFIQSYCQCSNWLFILQFFFLSFIWTLPSAPFFVANINDEHIAVACPISSHWSRKYWMYILCMVAMSAPCAP